MFGFGGATIFIYNNGEQPIPPVNHFILSSFDWTLSPLILLAVCVPLSASQPDPPRLKRSDGFLGIHFDFHAKETDHGIGRNTTPEMIGNIIDQVHPDYLQIDCKGHPGISSYPTKVGNAAPGIIGDPLQVWRRVTAERGVALVMHYSGVIDSKAVHDHPDWCEIGADGKPEGRSTSVFGPYADSLLIPQLRELAITYGVDGVWVDGECWGVHKDYSQPALDAFHKATGIDSAPHNPNDPGWFEFLEVQRDAFRKYLRYYITEVKKTCPRFEIASNWAFSDHMPEPVCADVDFLSGDFSPEDSINSARISARYLAGQGKPWDLMAWSFAHLTPGKPESTQKPAVQLEREAAVVLSLGGGFQAYFKQQRDGSVHEEQIPVMAEVAKFCRARQAICHHATRVPQVALLLSTAGNYHHINDPFSRDTSPYKSTLVALLGAQYSVELLGEHRLTGRMKEYPLIVIPDWNYLEPEFKDELVAYVKNGGHLLLAGPGPAKLFQAEPGAQNPGASGRDGSYIVSLGKGKIATCNPIEPGRLNALANQLFPKPMVEIKGAAELDVVVNRIGGRLAVNLVNTSGPHATQPIIETIAPIGPLDVTIRQAKKPAKITLQPAGTSLAFKYKAGKIHLTVPKLEIHGIILVE